MPRRKKKKGTCLDLPRLQFVESPSNESPPKLSPDFGAINPITAKRVPVDDIHDLSWVTPQFGDRNHCYGQYSNHTTKRATRLRGNKSNGKGHDPKSSIVASKYKPLSFVANCDSRKSRERFSGIENGEAILTRHDSNVENNNNQDECDQTPLFANLTDRESFLKSFRISTPIIDKNNDVGQENSVAVRLSFHQRHENDKIDRQEELSANHFQSDNDYDRFQKSSDCGRSMDMNKDYHELSAVFGKSKRKKRPLFSNLNLTSSSSPPSPVPEVLVTDTPECDYDLTLRQREIKYLLRPRPKPR